MKMIRKLFLLLIIANPLNSQIILAQANDCPVIPSKDVVFNDAETPLYDEQEKSRALLNSVGLIAKNSENFNPKIVYIIKPNQSFKLLDQSGELIDKECWYKVESPLDKKALWARFILVKKTTPKPSASPILPKPQTTPKPSPNFTPTKPKINDQSNLKPTPIPTNQPQSITPKKNGSFYFYLFNIILGFFLLAFFLQIISSIMQQAKARKLKKITEQSIKIKEFNQNNVSQITPVEPILTTSNPSQNSNPPIPYEQPREIDLGILNYLRTNEQASFIDLLSHLKCDQQPLRDRLLILQKEEFIEIADKTDENNPIYKMI